MTNAYEGFADIFETDAQAEKGGRWVRVGAAEYLLARAGGQNTRYMNEMAAALRPLQRRISLNAVTVEELNAVTVGPFVNTVLLNWRQKAPNTVSEVDGSVVKGSVVEGSLFAKDGAPVVYTKAKAKEVLLAYTDLYEALREEAQRIANFSPEELEDAGKN
jgi:hypothetical protein